MPVYQVGLNDADGTELTLTADTFPNIDADAVTFIQHNNVIAYIPKSSLKYIYKEDEE